MERRRTELWRFLLCDVSELLVSHTPLVGLFRIIRFRRGRSRRTGEALF